MKKYILIIAFILLFSGCGTERTKVKVLDRAMDLYLAEPMLLKDYPCEGTSGTAGWIQNETYYFLISDPDNNYYALVINAYGENESKTLILNMGGKKLLTGMNGFVDSEGLMHILCMENKKDESELKVEYFLCTFDTKGDCIKETACTDAVIKAGAYKRTSLNGMTFSDGRMLFFLTDSNGTKSMAVLSAEGELLLQNEITGIKGMQYPVWGMLPCGDTHLLTLEYDINKNEYYLSRIAIESGERELLVSGITAESLGGCTLKNYDGQNLVYYETPGSVWVCDLTKRTIQMLFSYEDFGLSASEAGGAVLLDNGTWCFTRYLQQENTVTCNIIRLTKTDERVSLKEKTVLTLAISNAKELYTSDVNAFNLSHKDIQIVIKSYEDDESFAKDILTGIIPDLVDLELSEVYDMMLKKNLLQDLSPFLKREPSLSKDDFLPKALELYGEGEKLYAVPYGIQLYGLMGDARCFYGKNDWTLNEFIDYIKEIPDSEKVTSGISNMEFVADLSYYNMSDFVKISAGTCDFTQESFIELLECAKLFPDPDISSAQYDKMLENVMSGETLLLSVRLADVDDYEYWRTLFPGKGELMGFPTAEGGCTCIGGCGFAYAMTRTCAHKDEAWEFLKFAMTHEKENLETHRFPSYRPLYDEMLKKEKEEANEKGEMRKVIVGARTIEIPPADIEEIEMLERYVETGRVISQQNEKIERIIAEEIQPFFKGDKSARETADNIQNRVKLYLTEQ